MVIFTAHNVPDQLSEEQFRTIYRANFDRLYGFVSRRCGGERELAEDIAQEAWFRALREWRRTGEPKSAIAWLTTVARNLLHSHHRRRAPLRIDSVAPSEITAAIDANTVADSIEVAALVTNALTRLPEGDARLLESFHFDRMKVAELATAHGVSERAIEGRLRRARERLRNELESTFKSMRGIA